MANEDTVPATPAQLRAALKAAQGRVTRGAASVARATAHEQTLRPTATAPGATSALRREWAAASRLVESARKRMLTGEMMVQDLTAQLAEAEAGKKEAGGNAYIKASGETRGRPALASGEALGGSISLRLPIGDAERVTAVARREHMPIVYILRQYVREGLARDAQRGA